MSMVVRVYPLTAGTAVVAQFAEVLRSERRADTNAFYKRHGVRHESWHLQEIAGATWVICCTDVENVEATAATYGAATDDFDVWFKQQVLQLSGIDPNKTPLGPPSQEIFFWTDPDLAGE